MVIEVLGRIAVITVSATIILSIMLNALRVFGHVTKLKELEPTEFILTSAQALVFYLILAGLRAMGY